MSIVYEKQIIKESYAIKFIANDDKLSVGRAFLYILYNDLHEEPFALLEDVFVETEYRHQGVGSELVRAAIEEAKKEKCYKMICNSRYGKDEIHNWYLKLGFKEFGKEFRLDF